MGSTRIPTEKKISRFVPDSANTFSETVTTVIAKPSHCWKAPYPLGAEISGAVDFHISYRLGTPENEHSLCKPLASTIPPQQLKPTRRPFARVKNIDGIHMYYTSPSSLLCNEQLYSSKALLLCEKKKPVSKFLRNDPDTPRPGGFDTGADIFGILSQKEMISSVL